MMQTEKLELTQEWDKTFPQDTRVDHEKVTFVNRYGITLAADLYKPKGVQCKLSAIAVTRPLWRSERAGKWPVCAGDGNPRVSRHCL